MVGEVSKVSGLLFLIRVSISHCLLSVVTSLLILSSSVFAADGAGRRDPAPLPDDIAQAIGRRAVRQQHPIVTSLAKHLDEAVALVKQLEEADQEADPVVHENRVAAKKMQLAGKRQELLTVRDEVRSRFSETRNKLVSLGATDQMNAWDALLSKVEERFERIGSALEKIHTSIARPERISANTKARQELFELHEKVKEQDNVSTNKHLPTVRPNITSRSQNSLPTESAPPPSYMISQKRSLNNVYAFAGSTLLAPPDTPTEALSCNYNAADLGESDEVWLNQEIKDLAAKLGYSPARIFEYVSNNIKLDPFYGSLKGSDGTLVSGSGGATDQASLLIALLRASNIPARYVKGFISTDYATAKNWFGVKGNYAARVWLEGSSNPFVAEDTSASPLGFMHVWVEACVPYAHYRGARFDNAGNRWIPLDPSFKVKNYL
ncbi:MAG: transglutaminase-like domain-containing protein, partial [Pelobacteraceae bacterium]